MWLLQTELRKPLPNIGLDIRHRLIPALEQMWL